MSVFYHQIAAREAAVTAAKRDYLQRWGWKETCNTPGAYWLWQRDFADYDAQYDEWNRKHPDKAHKPVGVMLVPMDLAVSMTVACLDEQPELADDD